MGNMLICGIDNLERSWNKDKEILRASLRARKDLIRFKNCKLFGLSWARSMFRIFFIFIPYLYIPN